MKLIKLTESHYIIVDDSEIKEGDWMIRDGEQPTLVTPNFWWDFGVPYKKITHSTQPLEVKITDEGIHLPDWSKVKALSPKVVKELIGEVDKAKEYAKNKYGEGYYPDVEMAYNQALEDNKDKKYTEEDMKVAITQAFLSGVERLEDFDRVQEMILDNVKPKTEWEVEIIDGKLKLK